MMNALNLLASETLKHRSLWYPTILGVLVVICAVALFCGTPYMLLATNMGSRLGFLVASACLAGLVMLVSLLWLTNPSPVNTLKGRIPEWKAVESLDSGDVARSKIGAVQRINEERREVNEAEVTNLKAATDTSLIIDDETTGETEVGAGATYAVYQDATKCIITKNQITGGGEIFSQVDISFGGSWPWIHLSLHQPLYAVITLCETDPALSATEVPFGARPPEPKCADETRQVLVLERDLGSLRVPPFVAFLASALLLGLSLLCLHWRERDLQEQAATVAGEAEAITKAAADREPETV